MSCLHVAARDFRSSGLRAGRTRSLFPSDRAPASVAPTDTPLPSPTPSRSSGRPRRSVGKARVSARLSSPRHMRITTRQSRATSSSRRAHLQTLGPIRLRLLSALSTDSRLPTRQTRRNLRLFPTQNVSLLRSTGLALLYHSLYRREAARSSSSSSVVRLIPLLRTTKPTRPTRVTALRMTRQPLAVERRSRTSEVGFSSSLRRRSRSFFMRADRVGDGAGRSLRSTSYVSPSTTKCKKLTLSSAGPVSPSFSPPHPHDWPNTPRALSLLLTRFHALLA